MGTRPRKPPTHAELATLLHEFGAQVFADADTAANTHALPWGDKHHHGFADHMQGKLRCAAKTAKTWLTDAVLSDDPPFYWLDVRHGHVAVLRKHPTDPDKLMMHTPAEFTGTPYRPSCTLHLDTRGGFYDPANPKSSTHLMEQNGDWLVTPQALRHLLGRAIHAQLDERVRRHAEAERVAGAAEALHGPALSRLRGLFEAAGVALSSSVCLLRLDEQDGQEPAVRLTLHLDGPQLDLLGDVLAEHGVPPVARTPIA